MKKVASRLRGLRARPLLVVMMFVTVGLVTLAITRAATPFADADLCEDTQISGNAFVGHDHPNTSCGHYVSFGVNPPANVSASLARVATGTPGVTDIVNTKVPGDNRLFLLTQGGKIHVSNKDNTNVSSAVFLDLSSKAVVGGEQGLLGMAFDPNYAQNGYFYVNYTANSNRGTFNGQNIGSGDTVISRFTRSAGNANVADPNSELIIMGYDQPASNHNGGGMQFGPDGFLYISSGDGGGGGDTWTQNCSYGNGQCLSTYLGKILRIDVAGANTTTRYRIPAGNPFASTAGAKPEIWHTGLRNPWRFSFDRKTGDMFIGDVGQNAWEEIDYVAAGVGGKNFGWRCREGKHVFNSAGNANCTNLSLFTEPIYEYDHDTGCSITGGYMYRGLDYPEIDGTFIYGDYCSAMIWFLDKKQDGTWSVTKSIDSGFGDNSITAFGEDTEGEVYVGIVAGSVYKLNVTH